MANVIKHQANIATAAVGKIFDPKDAEAILKEDKADYILVGRAHLNNSGWLNHAAHKLGVSNVWANHRTNSNNVKFFRISQMPHDDPTNHRLLCYRTDNNHPTADTPHSTNAMGSAAIWQSLEPIPKTPELRNGKRQSLLNKS
ncbi:hypothetical protein G6F22_009580 [Rhizopus arrhizus]|nr:hypothetical protein G6F21_011982 [Rhizopus arrhizus]KAG0781418.1 hypothetical protein G6F22_009580 [Rhizopus arrhizus]KAG0930092.1 hypothetical protein G6F32_012111 [Rhizopus arrhizus]KAG0959348.1 hypothetical protein G6F31_011746 [Rhizopus arrhizus]KAG1097327.1 hypothetical protein G6F40_012128 [Rhizopus arrhizus]